MTTIRWLSGTAYDFFISLLALHRPGEFGLRPSWAAGVRQRLAAPQREFLEHLFSFASPPLDWISSLPEPKDALPVLEHARNLAPTERLRALALPEATPTEACRILESIALHGSFSIDEKEALARTLKRRNELMQPVELENLLHSWVDAEASSEMITSTLQEYYEVFFLEEEAHIRPALQTSLERARLQAEQIPLIALVENLSRGVHFEDVDTAQELVLVPSYWSTPLIFPSKPAPGRMQIVYGCRTDVQNISPGAGTPDKLIDSLKTLADPTRLRILQFLSAEALTPTELSRLLRLRPPTVLHHLQALRLAELVAIRVSERGEKRYACPSGYP